jgi:hypothetical protein
VENGHKPAWLSCKAKPIVLKTNNLLVVIFGIPPGPSGGHIIFPWGRGMTALTAAVDVEFYCAGALLGPES